MGFLGQPVRHERGRLDALDVPGVEILVAAQPEEGAVALAGIAVAAHRQVIARAYQRGAGAVFQAAVAVGGDHRHEDVAAVAVQERRLRGLGFEQPDLRFADALQVAAHALEVKLRHAAGEDHVVLRAAGTEAGQLEGAHLDRMVDQLIVVGHLIAAEAVALRACAARRFAHGGGHAPAAIGLAGGRMDIDGAWPLGLPVHAQEHRAAVEEAVGGVQVRRAHRQVPGVDLVAERQRAVGQADRRGLPALLVELGQADLAPARVGADAHDIAREVPDHVTARDPGRQRETLAGGVGLAHGNGDGKQVRFRLKRGNGVADRRHGQDCNVGARTQRQRRRGGASGRRCAISRDSHPPPRARACRLP
ncbi:hypothetical protein D9M72_393020 [compost metagenome]